MQGFLFKMLLLSVFICSHAGIIYAADLHVILVGDYVSPDIQQACHIDMRKMGEQAAKISRYTSLKLKMKQFAGREPAAKRLLKEIENLDVGKNDVILFYFTGHGYRFDSEEGTPWPNLEFPVENYGISFEKIIKKLSSKGAKLTLIIADCCNHVVATAASVPGKFNLEKYAMHVPKQKKSNYRKLFCHTEGVIAIVSSRQGQSSYCTPQGSFYTRTFIEMLESITNRGGNISWYDVFDGAEDNLQMIIRQYGIQQDPIVFANIK